LREKTQSVSPVCRTNGSTSSAAAAFHTTMSMLNMLAKAMKADNPPQVLTAHLTAQSIDHLDQRKRITSTRTIEPLRAPTAHSTSHALSTSTNERRANEESTPAPMEAHVTAHSTEHHEEHSGINGTRSIKQHRELKTVAGAPCRWRRRVRVAQHSHHTTLRHHLSQHRR